MARPPSNVMSAGELRSAKASLKKALATAVATVRGIEKQQKAAQVECRTKHSAIDKASAAAHAEYAATAKASYKTFAAHTSAIDRKAVAVAKDRTLDDKARAREAKSSEKLIAAAKAADVRAVKDANKVLKAKLKEQEALRTAANAERDAALKKLIKQLEAANIGVAKLTERLAATDAMAAQAPVTPTTNTARPSNVAAVDFTLPRRRGRPSNAERAARAAAAQSAQSSQAAA